jgi:hypothetical protein
MTGGESRGGADPARGRPTPCGAHHREPKLKVPPKDKGLAAKGSEAAARYVAIPQAYADVKTSGLTFEVKPGKQILDIELK